LLAESGAQAEALEEYECAVALRPQDYALWLELGRARDVAGDSQGALSAYREARRLAPFYAQPRWQLGNTLYRLGQLEEAFVELREAVASNPKLMPQAIALAWAAYKADARAVAQALRPQTPSLRLVLARFFARHGKAREAVEQFRAAGGAPGDERRALLAELLGAHHVREAYEVWASGRQLKTVGDDSALNRILNGGFEEAVILNDPGFGWQLSQSAGVEAAQETGLARSGAQSLRLVWNGNSDAATEILSQLILVEPNARYQLRFAARTEKLLTGGLPVVSVTDAGGGAGDALGQAAALPQGTHEWEEYSLEFQTPAATDAVRILVRRRNCNNPLCPAYGSIWLDDFSIRKI
jgi:tetratricopeptide (TPR) repeat protein